MDKYEIIKKIGEGSFGKIFLAKVKVDNEQCVIKEIDLTKVKQQTPDGNSNYLPFSRGMSSGYILSPL